jgi:hypothetical protein
MSPGGFEEDLASQQHSLLVGFELKAELSLENVAYAEARMKIPGDVNPSGKVS